MQITIDKPFNCVLCLRSTPGHKRMCNSFACVNRTGECSRDIQNSRLESSLRFLIQICQTSFGSSSMCELL
ncbi:hypothetical protein B7P43_G03192 [Cryptotermes secundus]|uniref:Uncharacterized protein n=1 Tax=Cryptotermes secundus TaxID=105785 RepID=A0A2J7RTI8_9NEOP|nr:hypothetical protein B7P43_G03192 [Cryptotermes secundus]